MTDPIRGYCRHYVSRPGRFPDCAAGCIPTGVTGTWPGWHNRLPCIAGAPSKCGRREEWTDADFGPQRFRVGDSVRVKSGVLTRTVLAVAGDRVVTMLGEHAHTDLVRVRPAASIPG